MPHSAGPAVRLESRFASDCKGTDTERHKEVAPKNFQGHSIDMVAAHVLNPQSRVSQMTRNQESHRKPFRGHERLPVVTNERDLCAPRGKNTWLPPSRRTASCMALDESSNTKSGAHA